MKLNKEILAIFTSLLLLAALVVNWGYNVYQNKISSLQATSNVLFFEALETTKERIFLRTTIRTAQRDTISVRDWKHDNTHASTDSMTILVHSKTSDHGAFPEKLIRKEMKALNMETATFMDSLEPKIRLKGFYKELLNEFEGNTNVNSIEVQISNDDGEVFLSSDTIIVVDFDTTQWYLEKIYLEKMHIAKLDQLKVNVYDTEDNPTPSAKAMFTTNPGKLGDVFFGRKTYAATVQNFGPMALQRMIPEILFGLFLYGLIAAAFIIIYRSLMAQRKLVRIKDEFVGNITHELKTPISVVNVAIEAIQNFDADKDPVKTKRYLDISRNELKRLSGLVDKVLHLTVNPSDQAPTEKVSIIEITAQVVDAMQLRLGDSNIQIQLEAPDDFISLNANISQVKSVIYNLIDNAMKYSNQGLVKVKIEKTNRRFMKIYISDQGIGIPKIYQDKIFDQFFRVPSNNVHDVKGYGLGLHNVKKIVEQYNGTIDLKSEEGIGSTFTIKWPIANG